MISAVGGLSIPPSKWGWIALTILFGGVCVWCLVQARDTKAGPGARLGYVLGFLLAAWLAYTALGPVTEDKWQRHRDRQIAAITEESGYRLVSGRDRLGDGALLDATVVVERDGVERNCELTSYVKHPRTGVWTSGPLGRGNRSDTAKVVLVCRIDTRAEPPAPGSTVIPGPMVPPGLTLPPGVTPPSDITIPPGFGLDGAGER